MAQPFRKHASFWVGGAKCYEDALVTQYSTELRNLQECIASAPNESQRQQLTAAVDQLRANYQRRKASIARLLF